tara:strand:+ start:1042 stop:1209 length:168 start_codon:yes stop_codon:yes gene_type:complete
MSNQVNDQINEALMDDVMSMTVAEFIEACSDLPGSNAIDNLTIALVDKKFEQLGD